MSAVLPRMLVVDDEDSILFAMSDYFSLLGFHVDCAKTRAEAEALLDTARYAVVIADLRLRGALPDEGLLVVRRAGRESPRPWILVLTAYRSAEIESDLVAAGADLVLSKPQPLPQVADEVRRLVLGGGAEAGGPA